MRDETASRPGGFFTIPNMLTLARLVLLPFIIAGIRLGLGYVAVAVMALVVLTDLIDGRLARRLGQQSAFGGTFDSTVDLVLIYSLFIALYSAGRLATYQFGIVYVSMLTMLLMQIAAMGTGASEGVVKTRSGKVTGALQYGYLLFLIARLVLPAGRAIMVIDHIWFIVLAISIAVSSTTSTVRFVKVIGATRS